MKLYRHYKNMPYKFIGVAAHSETQEDVVVYECRYENPRGTLWVRPKGMFFETVTVDGKTIPRFAKIELKIASFTEMSDAIEREIAELMENIFGEWNEDAFRSRLRGRRVYGAIASVEGKTVGFKIGYEEDGKRFYSWLGGVRPESRGLGIAADLMRDQHDWCRAQGYATIATKTLSTLSEMMILNLRSGFEIAGTQATERGLKALLEKRL